MELRHRTDVPASIVSVGAEKAKSLIPTTANWGCHDALRNAIMTHRSHWPADAVKKLKPILAKYL